MKAIYQDPAWVPPRTNYDRDDELDLRDQLLVALCTDHGHVDRDGSLSCKTCNRRVDLVLRVLHDRNGDE